MAALVAMLATAPPAAAALLPSCAPDAVASQRFEASSP
jgi:hypothetical protein